MLLLHRLKGFVALMIYAIVRFTMIGGFTCHLYRKPRATGDASFMVSFVNAVRR